MARVRYEVCGHDISRLDHKAQDCKFLVIARRAMRPTKQSPGHTLNYHTGPFPFPENCDPCPGNTKAIFIHPPEFFKEFLIPVYRKLAIFLYSD